MIAKGQKITPHKGGRSVRITFRATPEIWALLKRMAKANGQSTADVIEQLAKEKANDNLTPSE